MLAGTGVQIYGSIKSAHDQAALDDARAAVANQQADEIGARELSNETLRDQQAMRQKLQFGASFAASGKSGVGLGSMLQIQQQSDLQSMVSNREAQFQEKMLREQAGIDTSLAEDTRSAGTLNAIGSGLAGLGKAGRMFASGGNNPGYGGAQGLGPYPSGPVVPIAPLGAGQYGGG